VKTGIFLSLRLLEGTENLISDRDSVRKAFQAGRKFFKFFVSKVAVRGPGRQNQIIV
jgi:hypothetical protein